MKPWRSSVLVSKARQPRPGREDEDEEEEEEEEAAAGAFSSPPLGGLAQALAPSRAAATPRREALRVEVGFTGVPFAWPWTSAWVNGRSAPSHRPKASAGDLPDF